MKRKQIRFDIMCQMSSKQCSCKFSNQTFRSEPLLQKRNHHFIHTLKTDKLTLYVRVLSKENKRICFAINQTNLFSVHSFCCSLKCSTNLERFKSFIFIIFKFFFFLHTTV